MADDLLQEVKKAGGKFYGEPKTKCLAYSLSKKLFLLHAYIECPNGHPYLVGEVSFKSALLRLPLPLHPLLT